MPFPRRTLLALPALATLPAHATAWPSGRVTLVVPFTAGGTTDLLARALAEGVEAATGQPVQVQNRLGRGSIIGSGAVAVAPPTGQVLLMTTMALAINAAVTPDMPFDTGARFTAVMMAARNPLVVVVPAARAERDLGALLATARGQGVNFASAGNGTPTHLGIEMLGQAGGFTPQHTPLRGSTEVLQALVGAAADAAVDNPAPLMPAIRDGRLRALAVTGPARSAQLPDVPTLAEAGAQGGTLVNWFGLFAPAATPAPVLAAIHQAFSAAATPALAARFAADGVQVAASTQADADAEFRRDLAAMARLARERNIVAA